MTAERRDRLGDTLRWALESATDPAMAAADWLARDIRPDCRSAVDLLTSPDAGLADLGRAKEAFKTMRIVGETSADRRLGARLYAASIAAGLVHHGLRITTQSEHAILRALRGLMDDPKMPPGLREMAGRAIVELARRPDAADPAASPFQQPGDVDENADTSAGLPPPDAGDGPG